ncbi:hypothetical protein INP83_02900 [Mucilaginibacter sp. 21P]|uniref:hypothetical protein n=1 Tax=Mucilaginibacter sp. 21P TaxID=2778902 RepID=UPI001C59010E|nr:hypothetical protein [Mucilaginibacter sp. 21P]QXV66061.1 hypothetical protein INP83_02900 [Mucilaginibacter sp. 21P]
MDVLIFKTSVASQQDAGRVQLMLSAMKDIKQYNFDLEDCDNILRVVSYGLEAQTISHALHVAGFMCEELPY